MTTTISEADQRKRLSELVIRFDTAMLVTRNSDGGMHARPLAIADAGDDETLYFATSIESPKVREIEADPHVNVVMQDGRRYVSLSGVAKVVRDRGVIERLWSSAWKIWFPNGVNDPSLCLLRVEPVEAAYWDMTGTAGIKYVFEMARAFVTGARPSSDADERHTAHVKL